MARFMADGAFKPAVCGIQLSAEEYEKGIWHYLLQEALEASEKGLAFDASSLACETKKKRK
eukprot:898773-Pleurochrysis_carterae.AAC.1